MIDSFNIIHYIVTIRSIVRKKILKVDFLAEIWETGLCRGRSFERLELYNIEDNYISFLEKEIGKIEL